jgi:hypothetical protein
MLNSFYNNNLDLAKNNLSVMTLILKKSDCTIINQYRPISLINYSSKIISKVLANRLSKVIDFLIDK